MKEKKRMNATLNNLFNDPSQYSKEDIEKNKRYIVVLYGCRKELFYKNGRKNMKRNIIKDTKKC